MKTPVLSINTFWNGDGGAFRLLEDSGDLIVWAYSPAEAREIELWLTTDEVRQTVAAMQKWLERSDATNRTEP